MLIEGKLKIIAREIAGKNPFERKPNYYQKLTDGVAEGELPSNIRNEE